MLGKFSTLVDLLRDRALHQPKKTAFIFLPDGETPSGGLTYGELEKRARAIATQLQGQNAQGERALLLYPPGLEFIEAFFGCLFAGTIAVPAYPPRRGASLTRLEAVVADARAKYTLTTRSLLDSIQGRFSQNLLLKESLHWLTTDNIDTAQADNWQDPNIDSETIAFLQYTSGSTGNPKGAIVNHRNLLHNSALISIGFRHASKSVVSWLPSYHDMGLIGGILQPIYLGVCMVMMPPVTFLQRPLRWLQTISKYQATASGGPNFAYELCASKATPEALESLDLSCWEIAFSGAEPIRAETLDRFTETFAPCGFRRQVFFPCYGMAETTLIVSGADYATPPILKTVDSQALSQDRIVETPDEEMPTLVSCGQPLGDLRVAIAHPETGEPCAPDEVGEIWVSGDSVVQGYWNRPELTQAVFGAHLSTGEGPFLRTGDLGFLQDGELFVTGRRKDLIIIRGRNHYPQDIEKTVETSHPALRIAWGAAFAVVVDGEERLAIAQEIERSALRQLKDDAQIAEVTQAIRTRVAQYHELQPYAILLLKTGSIPKTSSGKIQRYACREGFLNHTLDVVGEWRVNYQSSVISQQIEAVGSRQWAVNSQQSSVGNRQSAIGNSQPTTNNQQLTTNNQQLTTNNQQQIQTWLIGQVAEQLGLDAAVVDPHQPFAYYGLDSVAAVRLTGELEEWLERSLSPTLAYDYPTIAALAAYLSGSEVVVATPGKIRSKPRLSDDKIAIVGLGCRFPGADNLEAYWQLLTGGKVAIQKSDRPTLNATPGGFLDQVDLFDPQFFNISPREAERMDPQQRLLMEVTWEALETGGIAPQTLGGSATGVFVGISSTDYLQLQASSEVPVNAYAGTGNAHSIAANRLSYFLDLRGPSMAIDTACSSSLVAVHLACQSLQSGECDTAIAGGVNVILAGDLTDTFTQAGMLAEDGVCKTFDADADGYGRGEGCGVVILKRYSQAVADGDRVWATLEGSALVQDGRSNGLTAPNGIAQQTAIAQALERANLEANAVSYVEAHGTGTPLGDPIEINALKAVLLQNRDPESPCWLGSVKTNIGHLEAAAGMAGLIKVVLACDRGIIPPHQNLRSLNPHIHLENTPLKIPTTGQRWEVTEKRIAGVSSFGFGGMNAHVIIAESQVETKTQPSEDERPLHLLTLSAKSKSALQDQIKRYRAYLQDDPEVNLGGLCFTANTGRSHFDYRASWLAANTADLAAQLNEEFSPKAKATTSLKIAFLCTGQGSQYANMGRELYETQPVFREIIDYCDRELQPHLKPSLRSVLYEADHNNRVNATAYTQPALFAIEYAIAQLWQSWGIAPDVILGHSVGEYVAACIAGVFSLEDGLKLITERARLMQALPQTGLMAAVFADAETIETVIQDREVTIAALNAPNITVISGTKQGIEDAIAAFDTRDIKTKVLNVSHAFHSPLMQPMLAQFEQLARSIEYHPPQIPLVSNLTGEFVTAEIATPDYWCRHILEPVRFAQSMQVLEAQKCNTFIEIGAKSTLLGMGRQCIASEGLWLPSLHPEFGDTQQMLGSLQQLYENGASVDWAGFDSPFSRQKLALPTYPFQRQRYWLEALDRKGGGSLRLPDWFYQVEYEQLPITNKELTTNNKQPTTNDQGQKTQDKLVIFCAERETDFAETLAASCNKQGGSSEIVVFDEAFDPAVKSSFEQFFAGLTQPVTHIIYGGDRVNPDNLSLEAIANAQKQAHIGLLHLVQTLSDRPHPSPTPQLWLITHQAQSLQPQERVNPIAASLWGMGRTIALELPQLWGGMVDLGAESLDSDGAIATILKPQGENQILLRQNRRYVPRLRPQSSPKSNNLSIQSDATYLITGGLGSLGLKTAQWLIEQGATSLVLTGRNVPQNNAKITALEAQGAKITCIAADVTDPQDVAYLLQEIAPLLPLRGIIHAAGILADNAIAQQTPSQFEEVFAPKGLGAWNLHTATLDYDLDFFVLYSSIAAILGSPGQSNYAAANGFLDGLARDRAALGLPALSINWSAWGQGGMAQQQEKRLEALGLKPLAPNLAVKALFSAISSQDSQKLVIDADWQKVAGVWGEIPPLLRDLVQFPETEETQSSPWLERLQTASPDQQTPILQDYLQQQIAQALHLQPQQIQPSRNLLDLGLDSLMLMETINQLKNDLQLLLYPREFYERPRIDALAEYIAAEFNRTHNPTKDIAATDTASEVSLEIGSNTTETGPILERKLDPAVFILSSPRAGSTLLRVMLAGHPQLFSPPELHLLPFTTLAERETELALTNLDEGLVRSLMELFELDADGAIALTAEMSHSGLSIPDVYAKLQKGAQPRLLVDKSPTYALHRTILDRAEAWFEKAKYIHLIRHPYAVVESFTRLRMEKLLGNNSGNPYAVAEKVWRTCNQNILDFGQTVDDRYLLVYYENLVKQPRCEMRRICEFLDIPWSEAVLQPYQGDRMTDGTQHNSLSIGDPNFKERRQLDPSLADVWQTIELPRPLNAKTQALAEGLDYPLPHQVKPQLGEATMQEQFIDVRGQKLCVCTWGDPEHPPVLLLHGILEQGAAWQPTAQALAAQGYWCIAPDLRGHGRSDYAPGGAYRLLDFLGDLDVLAQTLNLQPCLVVGHSLGSAIAALWASARPSRVKSLVFVETVLPVENSSEISAQLTAHLDRLQVAPQHSVFPSLEVVAKRLQAGTPGISDDLALFLAQRHTEPCEGGWRWRWDVRLSDRSSFGFGGLSFDRSQYLQLLQDLSCPITLIYGDRSTFNRREDLVAQQQAMASARRFQLQGGHNLHLDAPDDLADIISDEL